MSRLDKEGGGKWEQESLPALIVADVTTVPTRFRCPLNYDPNERESEERWKKIANDEEGGVGVGCFGK